MSIENLHEIEHRERHETRLGILYGIALAALAVGIVVMVMLTLLGK